MHRVRNIDPRAFGLTIAAWMLATCLAPRPAVAQQLVRITIQPASVDLALDEVILLRAIATFADASTADISELVEWRTSNTAVVRVSNTGGSKGRTTARAGGNASISVRDPVSGVTSGQSGGSCAVQVLGKLKAISVTPEDRRIEVGTARSFVATGTFSSGASRVVTEQVSWSSSNPGVAIVSNEPGTRGRVTAVAPGVADLTATSSAGVTSPPARVRVPSTLVSVSVTPATSRVPIGLTISLDTEGRFSDGSVEDVSSDVIWTSSDPTVATVSDLPGSKGEVTALKAGTTLISVVDPDTGVSSTPSGGDALVTVAGSVVALTLDPEEESLPIGLTRSISVRATLDDGGEPISLSRRTVQWASSDSGVATVSNDPSSAGVVTGVARGVAVISASVAGVTSTASGGDSSISVVGKMLGVKVTPNRRDVFVGQTKRMSAIVICEPFPDGSACEVRLTRDIEFSSSETAIAGVSNGAGGTSRGDVTGQAKGRATISVLHKPTGMSSRDVAGRDAIVTVLGRLESLAVDPEKAFYPLGSEPRLRARATFDDGGSRNIGSDVDWTSSDPEVAEVRNVSPDRGKLFPKKVGKVTLTAVEPTSGLSTANSGGDGVAVIVDGLVRLRVREGATEMRTGDVFNLRAVGLFPHPAPDPGEAAEVEVDMSDFVVFESSNPAVLRIDAENRQALAVGLGEATVSARDPRSGILSSQSANGDALFRVVAALERLKLTPRRVKVPLAGGKRRSVTAIGMYTDGARIEITDRVTYATGNAGVAEVSNDADRHGIVLPIGAGSTMVTAVEPITGVQAAKPRRITVKGSRGRRGR